jgi:hypothetical protein
MARPVTGSIVLVLGPVLGLAARFIRRLKGDALGLGFWHGRKTGAGTLGRGPATSKL